jgi:(2Fe-2S) ferredoxin
VDYLLTDVDDCTLKLCSKKFNCIDVFYKVVDSRELAFGQTAQMDISQISSFTPSEYQVLNNNVATVDESGCVTACGIGSTFVVAKDGDKRVAMKITVTSLVDVHAAEVYESVDDVLETS